MIIEQTVDRSQSVSPTEATVLEQEPLAVATVHYKSSVVSDAQISRDEIVEQHDEEKIKYNREKRSPNIERICKTMQTIIGNAYQVPAHVDRTLRTGEYCQTFYRANVWKKLTNLLCTLPDKPESPWVIKRRNWNYVVAKGHRACADIIGCTNSTCFIKSRTLMTLRGLHKAEGRQQKWLIPNISDGWVCWLSYGRGSILHLGH